MLVFVFFLWCHPWQTIKTNTSKFLLLSTFNFLSSLARNIQVWTLFRANFGLMTSPRCLKSSKHWENERFHKQIVYLKLPFTFDFHFDINIGTWNTSLDPLTHFWVDAVTSNFEVVVSETNTSSQSFLYYWFSSFYYHWCMKYKSESLLT